VLGDRRFLEKLKGKKNAVMKGNVKDQPSYRMIKSIEAGEVLKQAARYFRLNEADLTEKRGRHRQERAVIMELMHRHSGLKQREIGKRLGGLDEGLVSRDRKGIRGEIETEPRVRKWFRELDAQLST
jgi:chromosomal replication initiation ATPase DnaA